MNNHIFDVLSISCIIFLIAILFMIIGYYTLPLDKDDSND
jgi:hypothetical protein